MTAVERAYRNYVERRFPLPAEDDIAALEGRIGVRLPPEYRDFLLCFNGGRFRYHSLVLPEEVSGDQVDVLYGIGADHPSAELGKPSDMDLFDGNDPPEIVIIGNTVSNQLIVLGVHPETHGQILLKTYWSRVSKTRQEWFFLDDSLEEFFERISDPVETG